MSDMNQAALFRQLPANVLSSLLANMPDDVVTNFMADEPALVVEAIPLDRVRRLLAPLKALPQQAKSSGHQQGKKYFCSHCKKPGHTIVKCTERCSCCDVVVRNCLLRTRAPKRSRADQALPAPTMEMNLPTATSTMSNAEFLATLNADSVDDEDDDDEDDEDSVINNAAETF